MRDTAHKSGSGPTPSKPRKMRWYRVVGQNVYTARAFYLYRATKKEAMLDVQILGNKVILTDLAPPDFPAHKMDKRTIYSRLMIGDMKGGIREANRYDVETSVTEDKP